MLLVLSGSASISAHTYFLVLPENSLLHQLEVLREACSMPIAISSATICAAG